MQVKGVNYDLYHCMELGLFPTVIARYSVDGPGYVSGMEFAKPYVHPSGEVKEGHPALVEAKRRAEDKGLDVNREEKNPIPPFNGDFKGLIVRTIKTYSEVLLKEGEGHLKLENIINATLGRPLGEIKISPHGPSGIRIDVPIFIDF
jgi:hypothetical protein